MGTMYIGAMQLRYDVSGGTHLKFSDGQQRVFIPDPKDASLYVQAEAMGYGRQIGVLTRDRILMHCLLADIEGIEPWHLMQNSPWPWVDRVDMLICLMNQVRCQYRPHGGDQEVLGMAITLLQGGGDRA